MNTKLVYKSFKWIRTLTTAQLLQLTIATEKLHKWVIQGKLYKLYYIVLWISV